jgi:hypothetical protein
MSQRKIRCLGSGTRASHMPTGKNPKVTCFRCNKRVGVMHTGNIKKHDVLARVSGKSVSVIPVR